MSKDVRARAGNARGSPGFVPRSFNVFCIKSAERGPSHTPITNPRASRVSRAFFKTIRYRAGGFANPNRNNVNNFEAVFSASHFYEDATPHAMPVDFSAPAQAHFSERYLGGRPMKIFQT